MKQRHDDRSGERSHRPGQHAAKPPHYAGAPDDAALYDGLPSVTNREWGVDRHEDTESLGARGFFDKSADLDKLGATLASAAA